MNIFGTRLKELRKSKGYGQKELGALIGVSDSSIRKYESGDRTPSPDAIRILANHLEVTTDYLLGQSNPSSHTTSPTTPPESQTPYYLDPEVAELADRMKNQPGMRILFDAAKDVSKEDLETVAKMMEALKKTKK